MKDYEECMCPDCLKDGLGLFCQEIATFSFAILYIMTSRLFLRLCAIVVQVWSPTLYI